MNTIASKDTHENWKTWLGSNWIPLLVVAVLGLLPFLSVLLSGQILFASDQQAAPSWNWYFDALRHGEIPLWNPHGFGGMPTFDAMAGDASYPFFLLLGFLLPVTYIVTFNFILHTLIAGISAYILVQRFFKLDRWLATTLAVAYMLNTNFISLIYSGHTAKFYITAWLPLSLYCLLRALGSSASWRHMLGLSLSVALFILTAHLQFAYYVLMGYFLVWVYFLTPALRSKRFAKIGSLTLRFWVPVLLGLGLTFVIIYPPLKYNKDFSVRGTGTRITYEYATSWSMHPEETASLIVPEFGGINDNYWGRNYFKLNSEYPGLLVWFLALLGLFTFRKRKWFWFWGGLGLLSIIFGLGADTPFFRLFYDYVPGIKNFRAPSMILFWLAAALLMMSGETLRRLLAVGEGSLTDENRTKILKRLRIAGFSIAGIFLVFGLFPDIAFSIWNGMVDASRIPNFARQEMAKSGFAMGALRSAAIIGILTWAAASFLVKSRRPMAFGIAALAVTLVDLYWVDSNFIKGYQVEQALAHDPMVDQLKTDTTRYRLFSLGDAYTSWYMEYRGFEITNDHIDNEMRIYRQYRGDDYVQNPNLMAGLRQNPDGTVSGSAFLDLLNVKYLAYRIAGDPGMKVIRNASMLPRTFFVPKWEVVSDSDALRLMKQPDFDPRKIVYVTAANISSGGRSPDSNATLISAAETLRKNNRQAYTLEVPAEGVLVVSDLWFPHWHIKVDGADAPLLRADFAFRGVLLQPGRHEVEFNYQSPWIRKGFIISLLSLVGLILFFSIYARLGSRKDSALL